MRGSEFHFLDTARLSFQTNRIILRPIKIKTKGNKEMKNYENQSLVPLTFMITVDSKNETTKKTGIETMRGSRNVFSGRRNEFFPLSFAPRELDFFAYFDSLWVASDNKQAYIN